jgi:hydrocephalus-inducing protein
LHKYALEVEDTEGFGIKQENQEIELIAEAFDITVDIDLKNEENILDFEAVRVGEPKQKVLTLTNNGKYPVKYGFNMKKKQTREMFTIEPNEGELQPEETKDVIVRFESRKEFKMKTTQSTSDIKLTIQEGESKEKFNEIPINFNVNSVFSKYTIVPLRNINFGPMQYGENKELSFEIKNNGQFPFNFAICDFIDEEAKNAIKEERLKEIEERRTDALGAGLEDAKDAKGKKVADPKAKGKEAKGGAPDGEELKVSQYSIRPKSGFIDPENSASIKIHFTAEGAQFYEKALAIDISGRDFSDQPNGIKFDVSAESCIPGINTEDLDAVFEEQTVIPSLDPSVNTQSVITSSLYAIQERVFWFGTLIASQVPEGVVEKFKIMNPNKIPCTVNFSVKPRTQSKGEGFAFEVSPANVKIPPHENAYVKVSFKPDNMMPYGGIFEATVDNGDPESSSGKFSFELRGEGTLPTLLLTKPSELNDEGIPLLKLKKTRIGKRTKGTITIHNEGAVPATVKFRALNHDNLEFKGEGSVTLEPKEYYSCDIEFTPTSTEPVNYKMEFETLHNPFECHKVIIQAEGYQESVTFENLPEDEEDTIKFGDAIVKKSKTVNFDILNTSDKPVRFDW